MNIVSQFEKYNKAVFYKINSKTAPWPWLLEEKSVFGNDTSSLSCATVSRCSVCVEMCFPNFLICVTLHTHYPSGAFPWIPQMSSGIAMNSGFFDWQLQDKRKCPLVKWYYLKKPFLRTQTNERWSSRVCMLFCATPQCHPSWVLSHSSAMPDTQQDCSLRNNSLQNVFLLANERKLIWFSSYTESKQDSFTKKNILGNILKA